jgi:spermidine/putrescine transport system permease protein
MLVFLPALTSVAIPAFLNHASNGPMIGNVVYSYGERGFLGGRILANAASLSLVVSLVMFVIYGLVVMTPKLISKISYTRSLKNVNSYKKLKGGNI